MKKKGVILSIVALITNPLWAGDQAVHMNSGSIQGWATGVQNISYGSEVASEWKTPSKALGHANGTSTEIVCLGRGGQITLSFSQGISNGTGNDFAVFENGISDTFLELGWVEVSSDGIHFVRFPNYSQTSNSVPSFGSLDPTNLAMLASKYRQGYGTPFDLSVLTQCYNNDPWLPTTSAFRANLVANFPYLDLNNIQYVRIIDVIGDGTAKDALGRTIYDPYPTIGSAGFDLDAVAVLHKGTIIPPAPPNTFANWSFKLGLSGTPSDDSDGDGTSDLEEYFFGSNPTNAMEASSYRGTVTLLNQFEIIYHRDPEALGSIHIETVQKVAQTNWVSVLPDSVNNQTNSTSIEVSTLLPLSGNQNFYRLTFEGADE